MSKPSLLNIKDGKITVKLSELETEVLINLLNFASTAAQVVKSIELERDKESKDIPRLSMYSADAKELIRIITSQSSKVDDKPELLN